MPPLQTSARRDEVNIKEHPQKDGLAAVDDDMDDAVGSGDCT